jgi:hypothetical protein
MLVLRSMESGYGIRAWTKELIPLVILYEVVKQFVGSESGQKQSVKLLQNMAYNTTQHAPPPPSHSHTLSVYIVHLVWGGGVEVREKVEGQQYTSIVPSSVGATVHKLHRKYQP